MAKTPPGDDRHAAMSAFEATAAARAEPRLATAPLGTFVAEASDGRMRRFNGEFASLTGWHPDHQTQTPLWLGKLLQATRDISPSPSPGQGLLRTDCPMPDGRTLHIRLFRHGRLVRGWVEDVSAERRIESGLRHAAEHDPLTGLPNRRLIYSRLREALTRAGQHSMLLAFIDLDGFKAVNDRISHQAGDVVLCEFAEMLRSQLLPDEFAARLGGDEFVMLLHGTPQTLARVRRERLRQILGGMGFRLRRVEWTVRASAGCVPLIPGMSPQGALALAERRCATSKSRGVYHRALRPA